MDVKDVSSYMQYQMLSAILKQVTGDSSSFSIMMESIMKAMENKDKSVSDYGTEFEKLLNTGAKQEFNYNPEYSGNVSVEIEKAVEEASKKYNIDSSLITAVIRHESCFQPNVTSSAGAMGLMQLMPSTAEGMGVENPYDVEENIDGGAKYLRNLLDMYGNVKEMALSAYSSGSGTLAKRGVDTKDKIERLPKETQNFVRNIMKNYGK